MIEDQIALLDAEPPTMSDAMFDRGLERLHAEMASRPRTRSRLLVAAAAAAACLIGGVVAVGHHRPADSAAATVLNDAATTALRAPTLHPKHGQFVYQRVEMLNNGLPETVEYWIPADRSARETICVSGEGCTSVPYAPTAVKDQGLSYYVLSALPATGAAMLDYLRSSPITAFERAHNSAALAVWQTAQQLGDLLPPAQEAALFQALTRLPGVRFEGQVTTFDGRRGVAIGIKHPAASAGPSIDDQLVFAVDTHEYIGIRNVQTFAAGRTGVVSFESARGAAAVVNRAGVRP